MKASEQNKIALQEAFDSSPFEDIKFFVEPNTRLSPEACTAEALSIMPELIERHSSQEQAAYEF